MSRPKHIGVLDIGKTNAKIVVVHAERLEEIAVETRPNTVLEDAPWPHFDLEGQWQFFLNALEHLNARYRIDAISVTTHGAAAVLLDAQGRLAAPMLDYEHQGPDTLKTEYDAIRPDFSETGSPRLGMGLNLGAQLYWQFHTDPELLARTRHILTYPQYWGYLLTGNMATDVTSLGCHTDLWNPSKRGFSSLVERLGIADRLAPPKSPFEVLGTVSVEIAHRTGLSPMVPVSCGIHDSNASLLPYLHGVERPFGIVSTGTWVISMAVDGEAVTLDPARDTLVNVNSLGEPVPSARFMGGREYELVRHGEDTEVRTSDRCAVLGNNIMLMPSLVSGSGPFPKREGGFVRAPKTPGERMVALSYYLALMTDVCLGLCAAKGPIIIEGPFAANADYCAMLDALRPEGVRIARSKTGTSVGCALLVLEHSPAPDTMPVVSQDTEKLLHYARLWRAQLEQDQK